MRQAVLTFDDETMAEWGFSAFLDAGLRNVEVLSCDGPRGVARIHTEEKPDEQRLDESETIEWWEQVSNDESEFVHLIEGNAAEATDAKGIDGDQLPRTERVDIHDQRFTLTYTGPQQVISDMVAGFEAAGIDTTVEQLRGYRAQDTPLDTLTPRQQEVLEVAFVRGYYDVPRSASTTELAAELELDDSTVSEHLQRAERNLIGAVLGH